MTVERLEGSRGVHLRAVRKERGWGWGALQDSQEAEREMIRLGTIIPFKGMSLVTNFFQSDFIFWFPQPPDSLFNCKSDGGLIL